MLAPTKLLLKSLEAVHTASRGLRGTGWTDSAARAEYERAMAELADAWRALETALQAEDRADHAAHTASCMARIGDDLFWGPHATNEAIATFSFGLSLVPFHRACLEGIVTAYLQGCPRRPEKALPYAERLAAIDPAHEQNVSYIRSLVAGR